MYKKILLLSIALILSSITLASALTETNTIMIKDKEYTSITSAIEKASYGDIILLSPGIYNENIILNKSGITIKSIERGGAIVKPISIQASNVTVDGVKVTEVEKDSINTYNRQSINIKSGKQDINIINCIFKLDKYDINNNGIRTQLENKNITIENNSFENYENAVCVFFGSENINLINNKLINNIVGFEISKSDNVVITQNEFIHTQGLKFIDNTKDKDINTIVKNNKFISSSNTKHISIKNGKLDVSNNFWGCENPTFNDILSGNINSKPYFQDENMIELSNQVHSINVNSHPNSININDTIKLEVSVKGGYDIEPIITFESSNPKIASVNNKGEITGIDIGNVDINIYAGDKAVTTKLEVVEPLKEIEEPVQKDETSSIDKVPGIDIEKPLNQENPSHIESIPNINTDNIIDKLPESIILENKPAILFTDIQKHWAKDQIENFINKGYVYGYTDTKFIPNNPITRAEFIAIINRVFGLSDKNQVEFIDINKDKWYYNDICIASKYINGYTDKTFKPDNFISREEVAVIVSKIANLNEDEILSYTDSNNISSWSKDAINKISNSKIMIGYENGMFMPKEKITRAEAVVALSRLK